MTEKIVDLEKFTEKSLQVSANILGGRAARAKLMEFYLYRGAAISGCEKARKYGFQGAPSAPLKASG